MIDLLNTKDTGLLGSIGEIIAWQYLYRKGITAVSLGLGRPWFISGAQSEEAKLPFDRFLEYTRLTKRQLDYLINLQKVGPRRWDFIATSRRNKGKKRRMIYLIEVKVKRQGKNRHDLRGSMKGKIPEDYRKVKSLGFVPLLVIVSLLDNWRIKVDLEEFDSEPAVVKPEFITKSSSYDRSSGWGASR